MDSKVSFDCGRGRQQGYIRWQFWFDLVSAPWWLVVRYYYTNEPKRGVRAPLRMHAWLRRAPPVDARCGGGVRAEPFITSYLRTGEVPLATRAARLLGPVRAVVGSRTACRN